MSDSGKDSGQSPSEDNGGPDLAAAYSLSSPEDNRKLYRDWAPTYDADFAERSGYRLAQLVGEALTAAMGEMAAAEGTVSGPVLDAGCGTGLVADHLPQELVVDGLDISQEMLAQARAKGRYRALIEADLTQPLAIEDGRYAGLASAGAFTYGHLGPEPLRELMRVMRPGAVCAVTGRAGFFEEAGFAALYAALTDEGVITRPEVSEVRVYAAAGAPPAGHERDVAYLVQFRRL